MLIGYFQKNKERLSKKILVKGTKIFLEKKKTKSANLFVSDIEIFLKRSVNIFVNEDDKNKG